MKLASRGLSEFDIKYLPLEASLNLLLVVDAPIPCTRCPHVDHAYLVVNLKAASSVSHSLDKVFSCSDETETMAKLVSCLWIFLRHS
jgi:hypothetical protein